MPYEVRKAAGSCPASKPWAVIKTGTGRVMGCHPTQEDAMAHMRALIANERESGSGPRQR